MSLLESALSYANRGWLVIPLHSIRNGACTCGRQCKSPAKHPRTFRGLADASADLDQVKSWWTLWPDSNIGILTGAESGIAVVDIDDPEIAPEFPDSVMSRTGSGGRHILYRHPGGRVKTGVRILPGTDSRGDGGYIVAPPSRHLSGELYTWIEGPDDRELADLPEFWINALETKKALEGPSVDFGASVGEGGRNDYLARKAGKYRALGWDNDKIALNLHHDNKNYCKPPLDDGEVDRIVSSVGRYDSLPSEEEAERIVGGLKFVSGVPIEKFERLPFELLKVDDFDDSEPQHVIRGLLEPDSLCMVFGESGAGKSFVVVDMALSIATGKDYHGRETKAGPVIYLAGEGVRGLRKRAKAWGVGHGVNVQEAKFWLSRRPFDLMDSGSVSQVMEAIESILDGNPPELVIIDTLARNFGGGDENNTQDVNAAIKMLDDIRIKYGCAVMIVHHTGHSTTGRARGSSAIKAAMDFEFLVKHGDGCDIAMECTKLKDGETPAPMAFNFADVEIGGVDYYGEALRSAYLEIGESEGEKEGNKKTGMNQQAAMNLLKIMVVSGPVSFDAWFAEYRARQKEDAKPKRTLQSLISSGQVRMDNLGFVQNVVNL